MSRIVGPLVCLIGAGILIFLCLNTPTAEGKFGEGKQAVERRDYDHALACLTEAIRLKKTDPRFYNERALVYRLMKRPKDAIVDLNEVIRIDPGNGNCYACRAESYFFLQNYEEAIKDCDAAIRIGLPNVDSRAMVFIVRGNCRAAKDEFDGAIEDYTSSITANPDYASADAYHQRGCAYRHINKPDLAIRDFSECIRLAPTQSKGYSGRAATYRLIGEVDKAEEDESKVRQLES